MTREKGRVDGKYAQLFISSRRQLAQLLVRILQYRLPFAEEFKRACGSEIGSLELAPGQPLMNVETQVGSSNLPCRRGQAIRCKPQDRDIGFHVE